MFSIPADRLASLRDRRVLLLSSLGAVLLLAVGFFTFRRATGCRHYMERAEQLLSEGRSEDAIYAFRIFSRRLPGCPRADESLFRAGLLYAFSFKDREKTQEAFAELGVRFPESRYLPLARRLEAMYETAPWEELTKAFPQLDPLYAAAGLRPCSAVADTLELLRQILPLVEPKVKGEQPYHFLQAKGAKCNGEWERAQGLLQQIQAEGAPHPAVVLELADLFFQRGKLEASAKLIAALEKETGLPEDFRPLVRFARAEHLRVRGEDKEALKLYLQLPLDDWPEVELFGGLHPQWQAARLLRKAGDAQGALAHYRQLRDRLPAPAKDDLRVRQHNELRTETAELLLALGRYQEGAETLRDIYLLPADHPAADSSAQGLLMLSRVHGFEHGWRKALNILQKLQKIYPQGAHRPEMVYRLGQAQEAFGRNMPPGFYREAAESDDPIAVPAYYAHVRSKQAALAGEPAPFVFARLEEEIAMELGAHLLQVLSANPPSGFNPDWLRADILYHRREWEKAAAAAANAPARRAKESLALSATRSPKAKTAAGRLTHYQAAARFAQGEADAYPDRAAFYVNSGRPDLLFDLARELSERSPPLWRSHYFRHRRAGLTMALPPGEVSLATACERRDELQAWHQKTRFSRLLFAAHELERMPGQRQELEKKSGLTVSAAEWGRFLRLYQPFFPGAASDLKEAHAQALAAVETLLHVQEEALELCELHELTGMAVEEITQRLQERLDEVLQQIASWLQQEPV